LYLHYTTVKEHANPNVPSTLVQSLGLTGQQNARLDQILPKVLGENMARMANATA
jgi:hypothetical protein